jgi:hypothetical protein
MGIARNNVLAMAALAMSVCGDASGAEKYAWYGWRMTPTDYAIVHGIAKDPTENDFYLVCGGESGTIELSVRAVNSGGYKSDAAGAPEVTTTFVFAKERHRKSALVGPSEMLGGVSIRYVFDRDRFVRGDDPILAAIARGNPFRIELPKTKTQRFSPKAVQPLFVAMKAFCKAN